VAVPRHWRLVFRGIIKDTPETWSHSHSLDPPDWDSDLTNYDLNSALNAYAGLAQNCLSERIALTDARLYRIDESGRMVGNPHMRLLQPTQYQNGGLTAGKYPPQVALVVTTVAPNRGPARFGRFYLPMPGFTLEADSRLSAANRDLLLTEVRDYLIGVRDGLTIPMAPDLADAPVANVSARGNDGAGTLQRVSEIRIGRVLDTQRRRRRALAEDYGVRSLS
jgi:hypothetical protein